MKQDWYVVGLSILALFVLVLGQWYVRYELRTRQKPPPALSMWLGFAVVAVVVCFGAGWTSHVVLGS